MLSYAPHLRIYLSPLILTRPVVGLVAGVCDLRPQLQVVSSLVVGGPVGAQRKHASGEAGQVAHLPLQVAVLPLANERQAAVGLAYQVALDGLEGGSGNVSASDLSIYEGRFYKVERGGEDVDGIQMHGEYLYAGRD